MKPRAAGGVVCAAALLLAARPAAGAAAGLDPLLSLCLASDPATTPGALWSAWSLAPQVVLPLLLALGLYVRCVWRRFYGLTDQRVPPWQAACFAAGWAVLVVALVSPLCRMAATLAWAHMVQHVLLVAVAPPLLVLGLPGLLRPVHTPPEPQGWRRTFQAWQTVTHHWIGSLGIGAFYGGAIWLWHLPGPYQAALLNEMLHLLMYGTLLAAGLLFWSTVLTAPAHAGGGRAVLSLLATLMHTGLLGAILTFAPEPWYPLLAERAGVWGMTPIEDQQLAGLIMWVPMGTIYLMAGLGTLVAWLGAIERRETNSSPAVTAAPAPSTGAS